MQENGYYSFYSDPTPTKFLKSLFLNANNIQTISTTVIVVIELNKKLINLYPLIVLASNTPNTPEVATM